MAMINDNDPIYELLDKWHDEDQYDKILEKIAEIPVDDRSNKLWFRKISALNNLGRFQEARMEISLLSKRCTEPKDTAKLYYMMGYTFDRTNCEMKAVECYRHTQEIDPEYEGIQEMIDSALQYVDQDLAAAAKAFGKLFVDVESKFKEEKKPAKLSVDDAAPYISLIQASFIPTGLGVKLPLDKIIFKFEEADKPKVKAFLEQQYGITDIDSLRQWYASNRNAPIFDYSMAVQNSKQDSALEKMNIAEKTRFEASAMVAKHLKDFLPKVGILAFDFSTILALSRLAYACDLLTNTEYMETALFFSDECKKHFSSWEEFTRSIVIGGFYEAACFKTHYAIKEATRYGVGIGILCMQNYPKLKWIK